LIFKKKIGIREEIPVVGPNEPEAYPSGVFAGPA
jgi:hypothetical protein